jgi:hypothetical protein
MINNPYTYNKFVKIPNIFIYYFNFLIKKFD